MAVAGAISTAAKPGTPGSAGTARSIPAPARYSLRQVKSWLGLTPCRRATPCTVAPGTEGLGDQPALVLLRPAPACLPSEDLDHPLAPAPRLTTPRQTRRSGDPPRSLRPRKAAPAGRIRLPVAPDLLRQDFHTSEPNQVWQADITYIPSGEGWLYLAAS